MSSNTSHAPHGDAADKQLDLLNEKLDRILSALDLFSVSKPTAKKEMAKPAAPKAKVSAPKAKVVKKGKRK
jgi:hypothetical protein